MTFIWPWMLYSLILIPLFIGVYFYIQQKRQRSAASYGTLGIAQDAGGRPLGPRRHVPQAFFLVWLAILLFSLSRPQTVVNLPKVGGTVILAFDVSGSMAADDLKPTRMEAAKTAARDFVSKQPLSVQIGVVAFSDSGFSVQAPTDDQSAILASINRLTPQRGTSLARGILASLDAISASTNPGPLLYSSLALTPTPTPTPVPQGTYTSTVIVLLTDGENNESPDPFAAAQTAANRGVRIDTVGIGSPEGTTLHINGFTVHTQLDEATLQQISQLTGGTYYNAQSTQDLRKIYGNLNPRLVIEPQKTEVTSVLAGASILIMLIGGVFSLLWFGRLP
jgi:Ca-activated chloride channel family protein